MVRVHSINFGNRFVMFVGSRFGQFANSKVAGTVSFTVHDTSILIQIITVIITYLCFDLTVTCIEPYGFRK